MFLIYVILKLTEVAGEGGSDLAPQNFYCPNSLGTSWDAKNM